MVWRRRYDPKCVGAGTSENLQGLQGVLDSGLGGTSKRQRGAHAAQPFMPLRDAGAELDEVPQWLQAYQDMDISIETLTMRCGVYVRPTFASSPLSPSVLVSFLFGLALICPIPSPVHEVSSMRGRRISTMYTT